jgi:hypothetical protein
MFFGTLYCTVFGAFSSEPTRFLTVYHNNLSIPKHYITLLHYSNFCEIENIWLCHELFLTVILYL